MSTPPLRRIAIIGAGAMGASLAAITAPHVPTILVVRNEARAERIRRHGVVVEGKLEAAGHPEVVGSIDDLADIHPIDLVFIATKTTSIPEVCAAMAPHVRDLPYLVSYQNGIEPAQTIMDTLGTPRVVRMVLTYGATIVDADDAAEGPSAEPLGIEVGVHQPPHDVGGIGSDARAFAQVLAYRLSAMGLPTEFADDIDAAVWRKGLLNAASNPIAALVQAPLGELMASPAEPLMERLLDEGMAVAAAVGIELGDGFRARALEMMRAGSTHLPSMAEDVIHGRATEITQLNVQVAEHGLEMGVPTPTHDAVIALIETFDWRLGRTVPVR
jgi:2-dehydropantoate 2-reductase